MDRKLKIEARGMGSSLSIQFHSTPTRLNLV